MPLPEERRRQLDEIVMQMAEQDAPQEDVDVVVNDFISKYQTESVAVQQPKTSVLEKTGKALTSVFGGRQIGEAIGTKIAKAIVPKEQEQFVSPGPSRKQVFGDAIQSAALVGTAALPGAGSVLGKAAQLGAASAIGGAGGAMAGDKKVSDIFKSALISGTIGAGLSVAASGAGKAVSALTKKAPAKIYNTTIKTPLQDTKKAILYKGETLGEELVKRGVKGGDESLFKQAIAEVEKNESKLQEILKASKQTISRAEIEPYLDDVIATKQATPGLADDVEKIKAVLREFPQEIPIGEANKIKRNLYNALDDVAFKIDPSLTTKKEAMKAVARGIKTEIENKTAGEAGQGVVKSINKELQVFGALKNRALDKIARANKNNLLGLGDMFAMGSGAAVGAATGGGSIVGAGAFEAVKRASGSARVMTNAAVGLNKIGNLVDRLPVDSAGRISKAALVRLIEKLSEK